MPPPYPIPSPVRNWLQSGATELSLMQPTSPTVALPSKVTFCTVARFPDGPAMPSGRLDRELRMGYRLPCRSEAITRSAPESVSTHSTSCGEAANILAPSLPALPPMRRTADRHPLRVCAPARRARLAFSRRRSYPANSRQAILKGARDGNRRPSKRFASVQF